MRELSGTPLHKKWCSGTPSGVPNGLKMANLAQNRQIL